MKKIVKRRFILGWGILGFLVGVSGCHSENGPSGPTQNGPAQRNQKGGKRAEGPEGGSGLSSALSRKWSTSVQNLGGNSDVVVDLTRIDLSEVTLQYFAQANLEGGCVLTYHAKGTLDPRLLLEPIDQTPQESGDCRSLHPDEIEAVQEKLFQLFYGKAFQIEVSLNGKLNLMEDSTHQIAFDPVTEVSSTPADSNRSEAPISAPVEAVPQWNNDKPVTFEELERRRTEANRICLRAAQQAAITEKKERKGGAGNGLPPVSDGRVRVSSEGVEAFLKVRARQEQRDAQEIRGTVAANSSAIDQLMLRRSQEKSRDEAVLAAKAEANAARVRDELKSLRGGQAANFESVKEVLSEMLRKKPQPGTGLSGS